MIGARPADILDPGRRLRGLQGVPGEPVGGVPQAAGLACLGLVRPLEKLPDLEESARRQLAATSPHAFRYTFGTQSAAAGMVIEVLQQVLGTASRRAPPST